MRALAIALVLLAGVPARADEAEHWYRGKHGTNRVVHVAITATGGALFVASETFLKADFAAVECRWCEPGSTDLRVRNALVWHDTQGAAMLSTLTGYVAAPVAGLGLVLVGTFADGAPTTAQVIDDTVPILETVALSQVVTQVVKFAAGRRRPFVHFGPPGAAHNVDDNLSFFSGHSALAFGIATSAGVVAHWRHYKTEPYIWIVGMTLAASTAYLRIAADKHYLSDVLVGSTVGIAAGLTVPMMMRRNFEVVPQPNGVAIVGTF